MTYPLDNNQFPLSNYPYSSRAWSNNENLDPKKNYTSVGFKPGSKLQASELNEIQENAMLQQTLSLTMMKDWFTELLGKTCGGPAWEGAMPLFPKTHPLGGTYEKLVGYTFSSGTGVTVTFNSGWYLLTLPSGLKQWFHLNAGQTAFINPVSSTEYYAGISFGQGYISCSNDSTLYDTSSGSPAVTICGADRHQLSFTGVSITGASGFNDATFNKVLSLTLTGSTLGVKYINGLTI